MNFRNNSEIEIDSFEEDQDNGNSTDDGFFPLDLEDGLYGIGSDSDEIEAVVEFVGYHKSGDDFNIDTWKASNESKGCGRENYNTAIDYHGKIIIVYRGDCTFIEKAVTARNQGAIGISIVNLEENGNQIIKMDVTALKGSIVAVSSMYKTAVKIWENMEMVRNCSQDENQCENSDLYMHIGASVSDEIIL